MLYMHDVCPSICLSETLAIVITYSATKIGNEHITRQITVLATCLCQPSWITASCDPKFYRGTRVGYTKICSFALRWQKAQKQRSYALEQYRTFIENCICRSSGTILGDLWLPEVPEIAFATCRIRPSVQPLACHTISASAELLVYLYSR